MAGRQDRVKSVAWDEDFWVDSPSTMTVHVPEYSPDDLPMILVPDGRGDYREHRVIERPRRRLGF